VNLAVASGVFCRELNNTVVDNSTLQAVFVSVAKNELIYHAIPFHSSVIVPHRYLVP